MQNLYFFILFSAPGGAPWWCPMVKHIFTLWTLLLKGLSGDHETNMVEASYLGLDLIRFWAWSSPLGAPPGAQDGAKI